MQKLHRWTLNRVSRKLGQIFGLEKHYCFENRAVREQFKWNEDYLYIFFSPNSVPFPPSIWLVLCYAQCGDNFCTGPSITTSIYIHLDSRFTCTRDFLQKNPRTYSEKYDMYNFLCFCESHQFFTMSEILLWYLIYLLTSDGLHKGAKPFLRSLF